MDKFLELKLEDKKRLIINTSRKINLSETIIEKDYWVCWLLNYLFEKFKYKDFICFKGGTSLSKIYHCIQRFSEDIDLAIDWSLLGLTKEEAYSSRSNRQQDIFNKNVNDKNVKFIKEVLLPIFEADLKELLDLKFNIYVDDLNPHTICFEYPKLYEDSSVLQIIRLEIGVLAEPVPSIDSYVNSYLSEVYPTLFENKMINIRVMDVSRTFFEKITILHREAKRVNGNYPSRYSRHFYDVYQMIKSGIGYEAINKIEILKMVVQFKKKFYPCNWAEYDNVLRGGCCLIPDKQAIKVFSKDYDIMKNMFYGIYPSFDEIIHELSDFEIVLNNAITSRILI